MLTSLILLVLGAYGKHRRRKSQLYNARSGLGVAGDTKRASNISLDSRTVSRIARRSLGIWLPFIATLQLGGLSVSVLLLISVASGLLPLNAEHFDLSNFQGWRHLLLRKIWTLTYSVLLCLAAAQYATDSSLSSVTGVLAVIWFAFFGSPPYLVEAAHESSFVSAPPSAKSTSAVPSVPWDAPEPSYHAAGKKLSSPLIASTEETSLTLLSGVITAAAAGVLYLFGDFSIMVPEAAAIMVLVSLVTVYSLSGRGMSLSAATPIRLATGLAAAILGNALMYSNFQTLWQDAVLGVMAYMAVQLDVSKSDISSHGHTHSSNEKHTQHRIRNFSAPTKVLLQSTQNYSLLHGILADKESRRIFYFMLLNLSFMLIQSTYGVLTGSLGLISDSIHMFFDCFALLVGLCAAVMSKWPPSVRYPYGYGKLDTLAGFGNGIFLMLISIEIIWEAVERLVEGSDVSRTMELLVVSSLGLGVNLVGIMAFDHGHAHGHGGHDHSHAGHSHSHTNHSHAQSDHPVSATPSVAKREHSHHHHGGDNMYGIYLHIMADALGSVAVVISTLCVRYTGWSGFDPLASCAIAILIFASAVPLVFSSGKKLLLSLPGDVEYALRDVLAGVSTIRGVVGYTVPKFWLDDIGRKDEAHGHDHHHDHHEKSPHDHHHHHNHHEDNHDHKHTHPHHDHEHSHSEDSHHGESERQNQAVLGVIHVVASRHADLDDVRGRVSDYLRSKNMDIVVQVERYGDVKCWCGNGQKSG